MQRLLIVSELYYPEETSTGYFVTGIAEGLAGHLQCPVEVLSAQPTYSKRGASAPEKETRSGVIIERLAAPIGDKNKLLGRAWMFFSLTMRFGWRLLRKIKRGDHIMVLTNPPSLPLFVAWICRLKGAVPVLLVHDVYPDVLVPTGFTKAGSALYRVVDTVQRHVLGEMERIIVLGRDMQSRLAGKLPPESAGKFRIIPNWGDAVAIHPGLKQSNPVRAKLGLEEKFIIQFSGNLGRTHGLEDLLALAKRLQNRAQIHFLVFGWGAGRHWLEEAIVREGLGNMTLLPPCDQSEYGAHLAACDLFFMPFKEGMEGISVPSRLYNVMAAGNPVLAVSGDESELAAVVREEAMGWVVRPGDVDAMCVAVEAALADTHGLTEMGARARAAQEAKYTQTRVVAAFVELFEELEAAE